MKALALLFALAACGIPLRPPVFGVDLAFTAAETQEIILAAEDWNAHLDGDHQIRFELANAAPQWWIVKRAPPADFAGRTSIGDIGYRIELRPDLELAMVRNAARHELGHALGMRHIPPDAAHGVPHNTMQSTVYEDSQISPADVVECRRVGACP